MIRSKFTVIGAIILFIICMWLFFPFPDDPLLHATTIFMSIPIMDHDGYIKAGVIGSFLFVVAMVLLMFGLRKFRLRSLIIVIFLYSFLPPILIKVYQETLAEGIFAVSKEDEGECDFNSINESQLEGECHFTLQNRRNEPVTFEVQLIDSFIDETRMESLINEAGPHMLALEANEKRAIHLKEIIDITGVQNHISEGSSFALHFRLIDGKDERIL
ncbi:hypothetical protein BME96_06325 [Virgibacillus halodenitrificans]|uniref:Uncharacterized protein n=1 Tax=Virgibacillus halodenitrificans TaxID=1482 RepID=A0AAC9IZ19_VIRHA|nr:hypothetical protein [Virgibacillus halodenitrificans]APC47809.1 hypothetical protein BME96_06325 [Virgibacillus halodenitrificans]